jgi:hypothetical protein
MKPRQTKHSHMYVKEGGIEGSFFPFFFFVPCVPSYTKRERERRREKEREGERERERERERDWTSII